MKQKPEHITNNVTKREKEIENRKDKKDKDRMRLTKV